jgi:hypothetical protein
VLLEGATAEERKAHPLFSGCLNYFADALLAVSAVSRRGNEQHHPGTPLHWDMSKSQDEADALARHLVAGEWDMVAWRGLALLQRAILAGWRPKDAGRSVAPPNPAPVGSVVHMCPPDGSGLMPCCGRTPFEAPHTDRITTDGAAVTCKPNART